jgi:hypothetical protein
LKVTAREAGGQPPASEIADDVVVSREMHSGIVVHRARPMRPAFTGLWTDRAPVDNPYPWTLQLLTG